LVDYKSYSGGKLVLNIKDPNASDEIKKEATDEALAPISFGSRSNTSAQVVQGYLGLVIRYKDKKETLSLVDLNNNSLVSNPEYEVTKRIRKLSNDSLKKIAFVSNNVEATREGNFTVWNKELSQLYDVVDIELTSDADIPSDIGTLVIAAPGTKFEDSVIQKIKNFFDNGGSVFLLSNTVRVSDIQQPPALNEGSLASLFSDYGVTINNDIVYDLDSNNPVRLQGYVFPVNYPFWVIAKAANSEISILNGVSQLSMLWANSISLEKKEGTNYWELIRTSGASNVENQTSVNLALDREYSYQDSDSSKLLGVALENAKGGRSIVLGDWKLFGDTFNLATLADNLNFGISSIEWLTKEDGLALIKAKDRAPQVLTLKDSQGTTLLIGSSVIPLIGLIAIGGAQYYLRRRRD